MFYNFKMITSRKISNLILILSIFFATKKAEGIIEGSYASGGTLKYQVSIQRNGEHMCGGTIISDRHILTAAHCFLDPTLKEWGGSFSILANEVDLNNVKRSAIRADVEKIYVPTDFRPDLPKGLVLATGDIAVLKLKTTLGISTNRSIKKADLPRAGITYRGVKAVVSGFGYNGFENVTDSQTNQLILNKGILGNKLRYVTINVISDSECQQLFGAVKLSSQHLCGKPTKRGEGTCGGDSGGPLVHKNTIIGVVSGGIGACGDDNIPGTYTRVSSYMDFINKAMSDVESPIIYIPV